MARVRVMRRSPTFRPRAKVHLGSAPRGRAIGLKLYERSTGKIAGKRPSRGWSTDNASKDEA
jgi:hypothetical protein